MKSSRKLISYLLILLIIINASIIILFSSEPAKKSDVTSRSITEKLIIMTDPSFPELPWDQQNAKLKYWDNIVRECAHAAEFFSLGALLMTFILCKNKYYTSKRILFVIGICFLYGVTDEIHQLFSEGRTFQIIDIIFDTLGGAVGVTIIIVIHRITSALNKKRMISKQK